MALKAHPMASSLAGELHSRPSPRISAPAVILQVALLPNPAQNPSGEDNVAAAVASWCTAHGAPEPQNQHHHHVDMDGFELRWEKHTEFSSLVMIANGQTDLKALPIDWLESIDAQLLTGALIQIDPSPLSHDLVEMEPSPTFIGGQVLAGQATLSTTLRANTQGWVTYRINDANLDPARLGRLAQRVYEIETYRMMALLGLPAAKAVGQDLDGLEAQLVSLVERLGKTEDLGDDQRLLNELFALAQASEQLMSDSDYRFSATEAYGRIVHDRLAELAETPTPPRQTLGEFLDRRFEPALRTTANITRRQEALSARIARTVSLARTRVEVSLQNQHRNQLEAMAIRAQQQFRLQRTVEGLSVMAISYYAIGIVAYLTGGWLPQGDVKLLISIVSPGLLIGIWWALRRWRKRLLAESTEPD